MDKIDVTLFDGDTLVDAIAKIEFALMEFGIKFLPKFFHDDYIVYEISKAEPLDRRDNAGN